MENQINTIYKFINYTFIFLFCFISVTYALGILFFFTVKYLQMANKMSYSLLYDNPLMKYYVLSIIWIVVKYI